jgi:hypothetical protein
MSSRTRNPECFHDRIGDGDIPPFARGNPCRLPDSRLCGNDGMVATTLLKVGAIKVEGVRKRRLYESPFLLFSCLVLRRQGAIIPR